MPPADLGASWAALRPAAARLGRRYYPVGIGAAFLAMVVSFFPSVVPGAPGGLVAPSSRTAGAGATGGAPASGPATVGVPSGATVGAPGVPAAGAAGTPVPGVLAAPALPTGAGGQAPALRSGQPPPPAACPLPLPTSTATPLDPALFDPVLLEIVSICETLAGQGGGLPSPLDLVGVPGPPALPGAAPAAGAGTVPSAGPVAPVPAGLRAKG